jgi:hypothetical protein
VYFINIIIAHYYSITNLPAAPIVEDKKTVEKKTKMRLFFVPLSMETIFRFWGGFDELVSAKRLWANLIRV